MVQALTTIFFSAAALAAFGVIVAMIADNIADIRRALGIARTLPPLPTRRVRVRRPGAARPFTGPGVPQQRAAA